jgi:hypothetical protein
MHRLWLWLLMPVLATPLAAQTQPTASPEKESFAILPGTLASGARNVTLRLVANKSGDFATSSSRPPELQLDAGVSLVAGSLRLLNTNEAECQVHVENEAFGTAGVQFKFFGVNGSTVLKTMQATLGIGGPSSVTGTPASVAVDEVLLVRVNVPEPQTAGAVLLRGRITGTVIMNAPTGVTFAVAPEVTSAGAEVNNPRMDAGNAVFSFGIGNPSLEEVEVRVGGIRYSTSLFGMTGGVQGNLALELSGTALGGREVLVVNAFTARATMEGTNDSTAPPPPQGTQGSPSTANTATGGASVSTGTRSSFDSSNRPRWDGANRNRPEGGWGPRTPAAAPPLPAPPQPPSRGTIRNVPPAVGGAPGAQQQDQATGSTGPQAASPARPVGNAPAGAINTGRMEWKPTEQANGDTPRHTGDTGGGMEARPAPEDNGNLGIEPGIYFCDSNFRPVSALVLDRIVAGEAGGRVWILLRLPRTRTPDKVDTVTVKLTISGVTRDLNLTETGPNTGEFRSDREGILLVSGANPDSNTERQANPPRPRQPR